MEIIKNKLFLSIATLSLIALSIAIFYFDKALLVGLYFVGILIAFTFFVLHRYKVLDKKVHIIFWFAFLTHFVLALLMYYAGFHPLGQGDFVLYQEIAEKVAQRFNSGIFYLDGINYLHYYPVLIGAIYSITMPKMIIGQLFSVWLSGISIMLFYFIFIEIWQNKKLAFFISLIICFYPSFIYFGSLMLKDTMTLPLLLLGILLSIKIMKNFDALKFLLFFIILTFAIHLRFYVGFALMFAFIISWFLISNLNIKKRFIYGFIFIFILGFSPQILGYGYYGSIPLRGYLNKETITTYREVVYAPGKKIGDNINSGSGANSSSSSGSEAGFGVGSSFVVETGFDGGNIKFMENYFISFVYGILGPFPWQLKNTKHLFFLLETIPWYILIYFIISGIYKSFRSSGFLKSFNSYKFAIVPLLFSIMMMGALSLFINNFGIIVRIRIPALFSILCLIGANKNIENIINKIINYFYEKKFIKFFGLSKLQKRA